MATRKKNSGGAKREAAEPLNFDTVKPVVLREPEERPVPVEAAAEDQLAAPAVGGKRIDLSSAFNNVAYGSREPAERPVAARSRLYDAFTQAVRDGKEFIATAAVGTGLAGVAGGAIAALAGGGLAAVFMGAASPLLCIPAVIGIFLASDEIGVRAARLVGADKDSDQEAINGVMAAGFAGAAGLLSFLGYPIAVSNAGTAFSVLSHLATTAAFSAAAGAATLAVSTAAIGAYNGLSSLIDRMGHNGGPR